MKRILSGVQPTGNLHLGNYLGAIRNWVSLQNEYECYFMLADLHAITVPQEPEALRKNVRETAAAYIACGIDPKKCAIFHQSAVSAHSELAWILSCHTPLGWLNRMTQFKEKAQQSKVDTETFVQDTKTLIKEIIKAGKELEASPANDDSFTVDKKRWEAIWSVAEFVESISEAVFDNLKNQSRSNLGLYSYPVLMAADILAYKATHVPVGHDQKQHLELARDIAGAFNRAYCKGYTVSENKGGIFPLPEPLIMGEGTRVMSLKDGSKKMSKSDESDLSRINLTDDADAITKKIKKATSDSIATIGENNEARPEANNLINIYAALKSITRAQVLEECGAMNFSAFKKELTDVAVAHLAPITQKMRDLLASPDYVDEVLKSGVARAQGVTVPVMQEVRDVVGFLSL